MLVWTECQSGIYRQRRASVWFTTAVPQRMAPLTPEWRALMAPTLHRLSSACTNCQAPFPHLVLQNLFANRLYRNLVRYFPASTEKGWRQDNRTARCRRGGLCEQWGIGTQHGSTISSSTRNDSQSIWPYAGWSVDASLEPERYRFWLDFHAAVTSEELLIALVAAFAPTLLRRYQSSQEAQHAYHRNGTAWAAGHPHARAWAHRLVHQVPLRMEYGLRRSAAGYALEPHTDICSKLVSIVLTVPDDDPHSAEHVTTPHQPSSLPQCQKKPSSTAHSSLCLLCANPAMASCLVAPATNWTVRQGQPRQVPPSLPLVVCCDCTLAVRPSHAPLFPGAK